MLSFLNPLLLWALPLAAAPVILHLIYLRRARRLPFSDLTLLHEAYRRSLPSTRLRQWLLLLLRCLMIAGAVCAFARPVLHRSAAAASGAEQGLDVVVLVDVSWSMGALDRGKQRLDWAKAAAAEFIGLLRSSDRVAEAAFSDRLEGELAWTRDRRAALDALSRMRVGVRGGDIGPVLGAAFRFLGAPRGTPYAPGTGASARDRPPARRAILVLSDNAAHLLRNLPANGVRDLPGFDPQVALLGLRWPQTLANAGISEARAEYPGPDAAVLAAQPALYGPATDSGIELWLKERRIESRAVRLERGLGSWLRFHLPAQARDPEFWGRLELRRDALAADDVYYYSMRIQPPPRVLLLYGTPSALEAGRGGYFLKQLLGETNRLPYRLDAADIGRLEQIRLGDYAAVIVTDARRIPEPAAAALAAYVIRGGGLWVVPGGRPGESYRELGSLLPGRLGDAFESQGALSAFKADASGLPSGETRFSWGDFELQNISVARRYGLDTAPGARVWFRDGRGAPLMAAGASGAGRVLLWASTLDVGWTNLGLKPAFAAWTDCALRYLAGYTGSHLWRTSVVGQPIVRVWGPGEAAPAKVQVRGPGGRRTVLLVRDRKAEYRDTDVPGVYFLSPLSGEDEAQTEAYAVNLDRKGPEGDLTESPRLPWTLLRPESLREDFLRVLFGREVRTGVLGLVALLFLLEGLLSRPRAPAAAPALAALLLLLSSPSSCQEGDRFVWTQARYAGAWDPYPGVHREVLDFLSTVTSVLSVPELRALSFRDEQLFSSPFLVLAGKQAPPALDEEEVRRLRDYLTSGGFLWIEDSSGARAGSFDRWVRATLRAVLPDSELKPLPLSHVLFKTFFLLRRIGGRVLVSPEVEGLDWAGKTVVVYTRNDLLGAWAKDPLGKYLFECSPGGEAQRLDARKLTLNILMYALTGTYKADAVHQPFLLEKMRSGVP